MRIYEALYKYLQTVSGVTALVGTRVYDMFADQGAAYPLIVIEELDDERFHQLSAKPTATRRPVLFTCVAEGNPKAANDLADQVYTAIMQEHVAITAAAGSLTVRSIHYSSRNNTYETDLETDAKLFACAIEFSIIHDA